MVDATPNETGRDVELLKTISKISGLNIICTTGYYFEDEGAPAYFKFRSTLGDAESEIYELFIKMCIRDRYKTDRQRSLAGVINITFIKLTHPLYLYLIGDRT